MRCLRAEWVKHGNQFSMHYVNVIFFHTSHRIIRKNMGQNLKTNVKSYWHLSADWYFPLHFPLTIETSQVIINYITVIIIPTTCTFIIVILLCS